MVIHVFPDEDKSDGHLISIGCWCDPEITYDSDDMIVIHKDDLDEELEEDVIGEVLRKKSYLDEEF